MRHAVRHIEQTILANDGPVPGNCMQACFASILDLDLAEVPHFGLFVWYPKAIELWLRGRGLDMTIRQTSEWPDADGQHIVCGWSPRGIAHVVCWSDGELWDPHPDHTGLEGVVDWWTVHEWHHDRESA